MQDNALIEIGLPVGLMIIMAGMGLSLTLDDFRRVGKHPRAIWLGTAIQILIVPALGFVIGGLAGGGIMAAGLVLAASCPGGTTSNLMTYLAKSNLALSITLTVISSIVTIATIPWFVNFALETFANESTSLRLPVLKTFATMFIIVILPTALGMIVRHYAPEVAKKAESAVSLFSAVFLVALIAGITISEWENVPTWLAETWKSVVALNIMAIAVGYGLARLAGLAPEDRLTVAIETGLKNTGLGMVIALTIIKDVEIAIPAATYGLLMYFSGFLLVTIGRRQASQQLSAS